ncbi:MAG TPA: glycosyltransferase [Candidatus Acidoferrum sp.]|nr:glycosyltransferase [Candidatus Acidoferrum sp.]
MGESLRIAFYTDTYLPAVDGVVTSILNTKRELERRGHEVYIFTSGESMSKPLTEIEHNVYAVHGVKFNRYPQYRLAIFPFLASVKLNEIKPDIIHAHTPFMMGLSGLSMAKINRLPMVGTFHTFFTDKSVLAEYGGGKAVEKVMIRAAWPYARFFFKKCNRVIAPSLTTANVLQRHGINNTIVVPNGVDTRRFNPDVQSSRIRKSITKSKRDKVVLYVGRMSKEKRVDVLIRAAARLKGHGIKFVFAGTGPAAHRYQHLAARLGLRDTARFVGFVPDKDLPKYYAAADVFCTPSTFETQGIVAIEAMAAGTPVVGANSRELREVVKNGRNGEKFRAGDAGDCARKIEKVINNQSAYKEMVKTAERYSIKNVTDTLLNVYKEIISGADSDL